MNQIWKNKSSKIVHKEKFKSFFKDSKEKLHSQKVKKNSTGMRAQTSSRRKVQKVYK